MRSLCKSIVALAASATIATATLTAAAFAATAQPYSGITIVKANGIWSVEGGSADVPNMNDYQLSASLDYSEIWFGTLDNDEREISKLKAKSGYEGNYKWTGVSANGNRGNSTTYTSENERNRNPVVAKANNMGTVTSATYYYFLNAGTGSNSDYLERSVISIRKGS